MSMISGPPSTGEMRQYRCDVDASSTQIPDGDGIGQGNARALGAFIRARREQLSPTAMGLDPGSHRRTPGLRRQEVAMLCGLSTTWYTWIEQGRPLSASTKTFARIADALKLSGAERAYLFALAGRRDPSAPCLGSGGDMPELLELAVNALRTPAYVLDQHWTAVAWNGLAADLFIGWLDGEHDRNLLFYIFSSPVAREIIVDWQGYARSLVAEFRGDTIRHANRELLESMICKLRNGSEDFCRFWTAHQVEERGERMLEFLHPHAGRVVYRQILLEMIARRGMKMVLLMPEQDGLAADREQ
jgi:transcriptional regulator with XRE-family HTH domain